MSSLAPRPRGEALSGVVHDIASRAPSAHLTGSFLPPCEGGPGMIPILQTRKPRLTEDKSVARSQALGHLDSNLGGLAP